MEVWKNRIYFLICGKKWVVVVVSRNERNFFFSWEIFFLSNRWPSRHISFEFIEVVFLQSFWLGREKSVSRLVNDRNRNVGRYRNINLADSDTEMSSETDNLRSLWSRSYTVNLSFSKCVCVFNEDKNDRFFFSWNEKKFWDWILIGWYHMD